MKKFRFSNSRPVWLFVCFLFWSSITSLNAISAENKTLDTAALKEMLENLGYDPKAGKYSGGQEYFTIKRVGQNVNPLTIDVYIGDNGSYLRAYVNYWTLKEGQKFPNDVLLAILQENRMAKYVHFGLNANGKSFIMWGILPNYNIRPIDLRKMLDEMLLITDRTRHLWDPRRWKSKPAQQQKDTSSAPAKN